MSNAMMTRYKALQAAGIPARKAFMQAAKEAAATPRPTPTARKASALTPPIRKAPERMPISTLIPEDFLPRKLRDQLSKLRR